MPGRGGLRIAAHDAALRHASASPVSARINANLVAYYVFAGDLRWSAPGCPTLHVPFFGVIPRCQVGGDVSFAYDTSAQNWAVLPGKLAR